MKNRRTGFFQQCSSCDWVGAELKALLYQCPVCSSQTDPNVAYKAGGLMLWMRDGEMVLGVPGAPKFMMMVQAADLPDVIELLDHWKNHPSNYNL